VSFRKATILVDVKLLNEAFNIARTRPSLASHSVLIATQVSEGDCAASLERPAAARSLLDVTFDDVRVAEPLGSLCMDTQDASFACFLADLFLHLHLTLGVWS